MSISKIVGRADSMSHTSTAGLKHASSDDSPMTEMNDCEARIRAGLNNLFEVLSALETRLDPVLTPSFEAVSGGSAIEMKEVPLAPMVKTLSAFGDDIDSAYNVVNRILYKLAL